MVLERNAEDRLSGKFSVEEDLTECFEQPMHCTFKTELTAVPGKPSEDEDPNAPTS